MDISPTLLPTLVCDAWEAMRTAPQINGKKLAVPNTKSWVTADETFRRSSMRHLYEKERGPVPSLTNIAYANARRSAVIDEVGDFLYAVVRDRSVKESFMSYCFAESQVLLQGFNEFRRSVLLSGMLKIMDQPKFESGSGDFGETSLRVHFTSGRVMITFSRNKSPTQQAEAPDAEQSVTFIAENNGGGLRSLGLVWYLQSCECTLLEALSMIEEVSAQWPKQQAAQKKALTPSTSIHVS